MLVSCGADTIIGSEPEILYGSPYYARHDNETDAEWLTRRGQLIEDYSQLMCREFMIAQETGNPLATDAILKELDDFRLERVPIDIVDSVIDEKYDDDDLIDEIIIDYLANTYKPIDYDENHEIQLDYATVLIEMFNTMELSGEIECLVGGAKTYALLQIREEASKSTN